jgi:phosphoglucosamine mutase
LSRSYFGTDGVRGIANQKLTPELAFKLGQAAGKWMVAKTGTRKAVLGGDTRASQTLLAAAVSAGLCSAGVSVFDLGVAPTPTVSFVARTGEFGLGVIVSASHNPAPDNGIKFVGHNGGKLSDEREEEIEALMDHPFDRPVGGEVGRIEHTRKGVEGYLAFLESIVPERLEGWKIAVDAANGAAFQLGPEILRRLGAEVSLTGVEPNGVNINAEGGATKPETICNLTVESGAQIGVAFDGDADRAVFCDEKGRLINGDRTIGIWALHQRAAGHLNPPLAIGTVMSNGGFVRFLEEKQVELVRAPVGDKYVAQKIDETGALIGGEQSGHIIFPRRGPTGDGLVTMLELFRVLKQDGSPASHHYDAFDPWPQLLINVGVDGTDGWRDKLETELQVAEDRLAGTGRLVVRPSGTQPMIRVMVEASDQKLRDEVAEELVAAMVGKLHGTVHGRVDLTYALGD